MTPSAHPDELSQSLRLLYPLNTTLSAKVRAGSASLTDAATSSEQIRFFQQQRAQRSYIKIAQYIERTHGPVEIVVVDALEMDQASRDFLDVAVRVCGWSVQMKVDTLNRAAVVPVEEEERALLALLGEPSLTENAARLASLAFDYVNSGDAWTALALGQRLQEVDQSPRVWNLLALASAMMDATIQAEFYYDRWSDAGEPLDAVRALYGKAMLYARHHPAGLRSLERSEALLNQAYAIIQDLMPDNREDDNVVFDEVFNRNGLALILFRQGNVDEAVRLLRWGIDKLTLTGEKVAIHRSVLIYNLAQCHKQSGDLAAAISTYAELLDVDPHMPEYHLEAAKCLAAAGDFAKALDACRTALELDQTLASAWGLTGVYEGELGRHNEAAAAHARAASLAPRTHAHTTDLVYSLVLAGRVDEAAQHSDGWIGGDLAQSEAERRASLAAEILIRQGRFADALEPLETGLALFPESEVLTANREAILSYSA
ncbi:tetratricopeptide repeat protein [Paenarthrobacter sp. TE4293]|uniref:tetratricopeptide repeat protein n=1 Tax=Paenarthrobacter sp. TE4293 TaxID=3381695 RepID=UPI003D2003C2